MGQRWTFWRRPAVGAATSAPGGAFTEPTAYAPRVDQLLSANTEGEFANPPIGFLLHGTRSGAPQNDTEVEYIGTLNYIKSGASGLGWQATIGDDRLAVHMPWTEWAWHAYDASKILIGFEFAQATADDLITDGQVRAACWAIQQARKATRERWGTPVPFAMWTHAEVEANGWTHHVYEGKTDVYPMGDKRALDLKARIVQRLRALGEPV